MPRCDRCPGYARTWWSSPRDPVGWVWCGHHDLEYGAILEAGGYERLAAAVVVG